MAINLTYELLMASSRDAGNASMRKAGRTAWNLDDWNASAKVAEKLFPYLLTPEQLKSYQSIHNPTDSFRNGVVPAVKR